MPPLKLTKTYEPYPEYAESGVDWLGKIPSSWTTKKIESLFEFKNEKVSDKEFEPLSVTYGGIKKQIETAAKSDDGDNRKKVLKGDIVINGRSDRKGALGVSEYTGSVSFIYQVLRRRSDSTNLKYFHHLLRSNIFSEEFYKWGRGIVDDLWTTPSNETKRIPVPFPPKEDQEKISNYLGSKTGLIDQIIEKKQKLIDLLQEKRSALITYAVTKGLDPAPELVDSEIDLVGSIPKGWKTEKLKFIAKISLGKMLQSENKGSNYLKKYLKAQNIQWENVDVTNVDEMWFSKNELRLHKAQEGDLLVSEGGEVGRTALWRKELEDCYVQNSINRVSVNKKIMNPFYLLMVFEYFGKSGLFNKIVNRVSIAHLTREKLKEVFIMFPSKAIQDKIVNETETRLNKIDMFVSIIKSQMEKIQEYRSSLIYHAVTGKIKI